MLNFTDTIPAESDTVNDFDSPSHTHLSLRDRRRRPWQSHQHTSPVDEEIALLTPHRPGLADFPHPVPHLAVSLRDYTARESNPPGINKISAHDVFKSILLSSLYLSLIGVVFSDPCVSDFDIRASDFPPKAGDWLCSAKFSP